MSINNTQPEEGTSLLPLVKDHEQQLRVMVPQLASLIQDREGDFLALGASLMEFTQQSGNLAVSARELADLCSGDEVSTSAQALSNELAELSAVCGEQASDDGLRVMEDIEGYIRQLDQQIEEFSRIVRSLQMLGISTRIESARLGDQGRGFSTLADDVESLANKIVADSKAVKDKSKNLTALVESASEQTTALAGEQTSCSVEILSEINTGLDSLVAMINDASSVSNGLRERTAAVSANINEVVASLQFHDIVRQQVEHVEEALADMLELLTEAEGRDAAGGDGLKDLVGFVADVSELQVSQLNNASERFQAAVESLQEGLMGISHETGDLGGDLEELLAAGEAGGETVLETVGRSTHQVLDAMAAFSDKATQIGSVISKVAATVAEMSEFVSDIEEVGSEIELIALNASIKAAHTGNEGKALGVLASAIQRLSVDARELTNSVSSLLRDIGGASSTLEDRASDTTKSEMLDKYSASQTELMEVLEGLNLNLTQRLAEVRSGATDFSQGVSQMAGSICIHHEVCPELVARAEDFGRIVMTSREAVPVDDDINRPQRLKELLSRYTMEMERLVHESSFGTSEGQGTVRHDDEGEVELFGDDPAPQSGEDGDEDWDNVDLF